MGLFYIPNKKLIDFIDNSGEFVRELSTKLDAKYISAEAVNGFLELGDFENLLSIYNKKQIQDSLIKFPSREIILLKNLY